MNFGLRHIGNEQELLRKRWKIDLMWRHGGHDTLRLAEGIISGQKNGQYFPSCGLLKTRHPQTPRKRKFMTFRYDDQPRVPNRQFRQVFFGWN